jgi:hypothetical protein
MDTLFFADNHPNAKQIRNELIKNITKTSEFEMDNVNMNLLKSVFFSDENIELINKQLILNVWKRTKGQYKIGYQDTNKIVIVMQYVYIEYCKNLPFDIKGQIKKLNCMVVNETVPDIITNLEQKIGYLQDIEQRKPLLDLPVNTTNNNTLPSFRF